MDYKFNGALNEFLANAEDIDENELEEILQEFVEKYNNGEISYENIAMAQAYELLEEAEYTKSKKKAKKLAEEAYEICPDCFDAVIFQASLEDNLIKREELLNEGLEFEKDRLTEEGYFEKENIGSFYGIFETRPYIRGLSFKVATLISQGKIKLAMEVCKEILRLNESDNTGIRYSLAAMYAYFEDEKKLLSLYEKYPENNLSMLFPLLALYYKLGNYDKAKEYLLMINKNNKNFVKFFKGTFEENDDVPSSYFSVGDSSEITMYFNNYSFLVVTMPYLDEFVLKYSKNSKK